MISEKEAQNICHKIHNFITQEVVYAVCKSRKEIGDFDDGGSFVEHIFNVCLLFMDSTLKQYNYGIPDDKKEKLLELFKESLYE